MSSAAPIAAPRRLEDLQKGRRLLLQRVVAQLGGRVGVRGRGCGRGRGRAFCWSKANRVVSNRVISTGPAYPPKAKPGPKF